jgi:hypothetical protein
VLETEACPVLLLTPELQRDLRWFYGCYQPTERGWQRTALPRHGGFADQPARLLEMLEHLKAVHDEIDAEQR